MTGLLGVIATSIEKLECVFSPNVGAAGSTLQAGSMDGSSGIASDPPMAITHTMWRREAGAFRNTEVTANASTTRELLFNVDSRRLMMMFDVGVTISLPT